MRPSHVRFAEMRELLLDMGFVEKTFNDGHTGFRHAASDTSFHFRPYEPTDFVIIVHFLMVRRILDERGLLDAHEFDRLLSKTPA
jgi:hypothetical protein